MSYGPQSADGEVSKPTRAGKVNQSLAIETGETHTDSLLPSLDKGLTLLDVGGERGVTSLQSLVLDHLLTSDGPAFWVDAEGHATSTAMARLAPSRRLLDRIHVARGFTAYQHYDAVTSLPATINEQIKDTADEEFTDRRDRRMQRSDRSPNSNPYTPSVIVAPALDSRYRRADGLTSEQARKLQARAIARLRSMADGYDVPVILTRSATCSFTDPIEAATDHHIRVEQTAFGPRFIGDDFETLLYPVGDGMYQTTLAYWQHHLEARAEQVGLAIDDTRPGARGGPDDGWETATPAPLTASPLLGPSVAGPDGGV